jgi:Kef-type K+ transport system membrane component KefB
MTGATLAAIALSLAVIIVAAWVMGRIATWVGQPAVIGEILAGILLGPTLFGGAVPHTLFPAAVMPTLGTLSDIGVGLFMFLVGLDLRRGVLRGNGRLAVSVALGAMVVPFGLGALLGGVALQQPPGAGRLAFVLFIGAAMAITAFPVLARILADRGLLDTPIGGLALVCAAIDDVLAWALLAVVVAIAGGATQPWLVLLGIPFAAVLLLVVRPALARLTARRKQPERWSGAAGVARSAAVLIGVGAGLSLSGWATEAMGLHLIFGAFLFGVAMPRDGAEAVREHVLPWIRRIGSIVLLPVFFTVAGLKVDLSGLDAAFGELALILLVAVGGKWVGVAVGARLYGVGLRNSAGLAVLLNTRGLTELIVLTVGLQLGVLDDRLYSLMVVMALVTTAMTGVLLHWVRLAPHPDAGSGAWLPSAREGVP